MYIIAVVNTKGRRKDDDRVSTRGEGGEGKQKCGNESHGRSPCHVRKVVAVLAVNYPAAFWKQQIAGARWRWLGFLGFALLLVMGSANMVALARAELNRHAQTEEALLAAEHRYRDIFENASEGIFLTSIEGKYLGANPALARIYGYETPDELMASLADISRQLYVDPARRTEFVRLMQEHGEVSDFQSQVRRRDGRVIWISENSRSVRE